MPEEANNRKWYKSPVGIIGTIFIGAIGSGLWDLFLRDALISAYYTMASAIGSISTSYLDSLHEDIGKANSNELGVFTFMFFVFLIVVLNIAGSGYVLRTYRRLKNNGYPGREMPSVSRLKRMAILMLLMAAFNVVAYSQEAFAILYRLKAITWVERSIEIIRPSIPEHDFLVLRSQYRAVSSASDFYTLVSAIKSRAAKSHIRLPNFSAIGQPEKNGT